MIESLPVQANEADRVAAYAGLGRNCAVGVRVPMIMMIFGARVQKSEAFGVLRVGRPKIAFF